MWILFPKPDSGLAGLAVAAALYLAATAARAGILEDRNVSLSVSGLPTQDVTYICDYARTLLVTRGSEGLQPFLSLTCDEAETPWLIRLNFKGAEMQAGLFIRSEKSEVRVIRVSLPWDPDDPAAPELLLTELYARMPFHGTLTHTDITKGLKEINAEAEQPLPMTELKIFSLTWDQEKNALKTRAVAKARKIGNQWSITTDKGKPIHPGETFFARSAAPRSLTQTTKSMMFDLLSSSYTAVRFGIAPLRDDTGDFEQAQFFGLATELRGGIWRATQVYYDMVPRVNGSVNGEPVFYEYQRALLGYGFPFPKIGFLDAVMIIPKIGFWNFEARLPFRHPAGTVVNDYSVRNSLGTGIEGSMEQKLSALSLRGWLATDLGIPLGVARGNVTSQRAGMDLMYIIPGKSAGVFSHGIMAFVLAESIRISNVRTQDQDVSSPAITIQQTFLGLGTALIW